MSVREPALTVDKQKGAPRLPGEAGIWVLVFFELTLFVALFCALIVDRGHHSDLFAEAQRSLTPAFAVIDTLLLLTSSLLVVTAVRAIRVNTRAGRRLVPWLLAAGILCAVGFMASKITEYFTLFEDSHGPSANLFFLWFFVLTGLHLGHVVIGTFVLAALLAMVVAANRNGWARPRERMLLEAGAIYWHMVDGVWVMLFPVLYLVHR